MTDVAEPQPAQPADGAERKRYGKIAKRGVAWSFFREGVSESLTTPTAMIMARLLTPFDFGIAASAAFFLTLATRLTNMGFNQALVRVKHLRQEHSSSVFVLTLVVGATAYAVLASTAGLMAAFFRAPQLQQIMPIAALTFIISPFGTVPAALMSRNLRFKDTAICDWTGGAAEACSAIGLAFAGFGFWSIVYSRVIGDIVNTSAKIILGRWRPSLRFSRVAIGELFSFGSGVFVKRLLDYAANNLDNMVVVRTLGVTPLGFYDKAFMTMNKVLIRISTGGPMVSFRVFSMIHEDADRFRKAYAKVLLAVSLVSYPVLAALAAAGPDLIQVMYGKRWLPAVVPFQLLCAAGALKVLIAYAGSAAQASGRIWGQVARQAIYAILIVTLVALFSRWGLSGAAFGVLIATAIMAVLMDMLLMRLTGMTARDMIQPQIPGILCGAAVGVSVLAIRLISSHADWVPLIRLLTALSVGAISYAGFLKFSPFKNVRVLVRDAADDLPPWVGRFVGLLC